jgi:hypothetical protein
MKLEKKQRDPNLFQQLFQEFKDQITKQFKILALMPELIMLIDHLDQVLIMLLSVQRGHRG